MHTNYFGNNTMPTVIYISSAERKRNYTWFEDGNTLHDENIAFCTLDDLRFTTIDYPANLKDGDIIIKKTNSNTQFIRVEDVHSHKWDKFYIIKDIVQLLGAKKYSFIAAEIEERERTISLKAGVNYKAIKSKVKIDNNEEFRIKEGLSFEGKFDGIKSIDNVSYRKAQELLIKYNLLDDEFVCQLVRSRDPERKNHERYERLKINLLEDFNRSMDIAAKFSCVPLVSISTEAKETLKYRKDLTIEIQIEFPDK